MENDVKLKKGVFGYNAKKADEYIENLSKNYSAALDEKDKRADELEREVKALREALKKLEDEKDSIANILISAKSEAKKIIEEANSDANKIRLQAEVELENTLQKISNAQGELVALKNKTTNFMNDYQNLLNNLVDGADNEN